MLENSAYYNWSDTARCSLSDANIISSHRKNSGKTNVSNFQVVFAFWVTARCMNDSKGLCVIFCLDFMQTLTASLNLVENKRGNGNPVMP